jgi:dTDP-4-dehydrorhamnose reductase
MKVLIVGANGQLGSELLKICPRDCTAVGMDVPEIDITDSTNVDRALAAHVPDWVVNCAAYTQVDKAESDPETARAINHDGAANLARAVKKHRTGLVHISTDFVFRGDQGRPYKPGDQPVPGSVYGKTKLEGERAVLDILGKEALIIRTAWLYASHGNNFVKTMLRLMMEKESLRVVDDQIGSPCWAKGLAAAVWAAAAKRLKGIFHWTDAGVASWYDFAVAIQEEALAAGLLDRSIPIHPVPTSEYPTPARRPAFSVLDKKDLVAAAGIPLVHWRRQLREMLQELGHQKPFP